MATYDKHAESGLHTASSSNGSQDRVEDITHAKIGYGEERDAQNRADVHDEDNPNVYQHMCFPLFTALTAMSFLWVGSQIPLYLYGSVLPDIYAEIGGADGQYLWMVVGYLIPNSALCPFVGALSDIFGRRWVAAFGQLCLLIGPVIVSTAHTMNTAIGGMVICGLGAGFNELIALAGTSELVPVAKRGMYVGLVVFTILPFCPSPLWAQLITQAAGNWRYVGVLVGVWNFIGLVLVVFFYKDPVRLEAARPAKEILREIDYVGGILSTFGVTLFMMGLQWGARQYSWGSVHVLVPFILGIIVIIAFFVWEMKFAPYPMVPAGVFSKDKRTMICALLITFFSGGNFFALLLFWPTQVYNMYGNDPLQIGIRTLPIGFGIILGAAFSLVLFGVCKGRTTILMIIWTAVMTAFTGAMSVATTTNLNPTVYAILTLSAIGVGAVIIPISIIAQVVCPTEYIGTVTAVTLSVRYIGGAIGFTAYYNVFFHKFETEYVLPAGFNVAVAGITSDYPTLFRLLTLGAQAQYADLRAFIEQSPLVARKDVAYDIIIGSLQEAFVLAYRWPYWISIAFGGISLVCACFMRDIRHYM
ncbi:Putative sugar transporter, major facilitator transporter Str1/Tri12, MFS transporter superfamily [Septoria linicola]|uniref:Sugar transporter, major facilitator transporter Str1/Tri12, MFS transporter superfamily n=1 Tax=Septoria linicola TaxID=215465 RepID=A0A9Q9B8A1_9PEZI|nr:Putative sugar transporter, major facilitator transporter Str1/Tri12, MFS transporter superfamily [Septoria linicola]